MANSADDLVQLRGMQGNAEGHSDEAVRRRIGEGDGPGTVALHAPAAARREAAQPADAVAQRDARARRRRPCGVPAAACRRMYHQPTPSAPISPP